MQVWSAVVPHVSRACRINALLSSSHNPIGSMAGGGRSSVLLDSLLKSTLIYPSFPLTFLSVVGTSMLLLYIFHQLIQDSAQLVLYRATIIALVPFLDQSLPVWYFLWETTFVISFSILGHLALRASSNPMLLNTESQHCRRLGSRKPLRRAAIQHCPTKGRVRVRCSFFRANTVDFLNWMEEPPQTWRDLCLCPCVGLLVTSS